jgi:hypothetical protein
MKNFDEIDELFGKAFGDFKISPPEEVKMAIDKRITFGGKRKGFWYFGLSTLMLIAFLIVNIAAKLEFRETNPAESLHASVLEDNKTAYTAVEHEKKQGVELERSISEEDGELSNEPTTNLKERSNTSIVKKGGKKIAFNTRVHSGDFDPNKSLIDEPTNSKNKKAKRKTENRLDDKDVLFNPRFIAEEKNSVDGNQTNSETTSSVKSNDETMHNRPEDKNSDTTVEAADVRNTMEQVDTLKNGNDEPDISFPTQSSKITMGNWIQFSAGPGFGMNGSKSNSFGLEISTRNPIIDASLEYNFGLNERLGISTGIGFNQFEEMVTQTTSVLDSTFLGMIVDSVWNPQTMQYDSITVATFEYFNSEEISGNTFRFTSVEIPVFATWMINKESKYDLSVAAGIKLSYNSFKALDGEQLKELIDLKTFGLKLMVRPQFVYHLGKLGLGAYVRYSSEILPVMEYSGTKRLLQDFGAGVLLRYSF